MRWQDIADETQHMFCFCFPDPFSGKFLLSPSQRNSQGQKSRSVLTSERIQPTSDSCLEFWYQINGRSVLNCFLHSLHCLTVRCDNAVYILHFSIGSDPGILRLLLDSGATEQELLFETQATGNNWENVSITVNETKPFQV